MIWLIGNKGMLGTELSLLLERNRFPFVGTDRELDITDMAALENFASAHSFDWIINCAAYTAVDKAEDDGDVCRSLNADGVGNIAATANKIKARLIHISTDYVFNGKGNRPYTEDDPTDPIGVYGLTKRDGELAVLKNNPDSYIIRTAWLYGKHGNSFVHTMLKLMNERESISVVNDQNGSPTWAYDLASTVLAFFEKDVPFGIYHFTNEGSITWFDFAKEIYSLGRKNGSVTNNCKIKSCTSAEFPAKVARPAYSVLDKSKIKTALGITIPPWDESLRKFLEA